MALPFAPAPELVSELVLPSSSLACVPPVADDPPSGPLSGCVVSGPLSGCVVDVSVVSSAAAAAAVEEVPAAATPVDGASPGTGSWKLARAAVAAVWLRSAALVSGPTTPSTVSPRLAWKLWTASSVSGPNTPSTLTSPSAFCSSSTCLPSLPSS